jgi:NAD(P)-dependent dehydrogenase (short-subunit alcohol dehydrogenase family)
VRLTGKVAIVTGGAQGVGRGICLAMIKEGAKILFVDRLEEQGRATLQELKAIGEAVFMPFDLADRARLGEIVDTTVETFGKLDVLVNNAQAARMVPIAEMDDEVVNLAMDTGFWPTLKLMQAAFPQLKENRGKVINFGSSAAMDGLPTHGSYVAAKEAIRGISRVAANEWGPLGITVNTVCPSANSPGRIIWQERNPEQFNAALQRIPLRRVGDCEDDIGRVVVFLASADSDYITGQTIMVNGGSEKLR